MKKRYTIFFVINLFFSALCTSQDLAINEVMASNDSTIQDNDGDYEDWIENQMALPASSHREYFRARVSPVYSDDYVDHERFN